MKFWNMPWGGVAFTPLDKKISLGYKPKAGLPQVTYQSIPWSGFTQTFASAVASATGPAVSSGGGTQAFQFAAEGKIAYADDLVESWKKNGLYDDFLPGLIDTMKTKDGYAAVPYALDLRVMWYNKVLLEKAGVNPPADWQSYLDACAALKKNNVYGFGVSGGPGMGGQILTGIMINNGGGLFDEEQQPNCVTSANIDAINWVLEMVAKGYSDPASVSYTTANSYAQWKARKFGMGWDNNTGSVSVGGDVQNEMEVGAPLTSSSGKQGAINFIANMMMYKNTPSQEGSEAFLTYYYQHMSPLWTKKTGIGLPVLKSITATPEFKSSPSNVKIIDEWLPVAKTLGAPGNKGLFVNAVAVDSTQPLTIFAETVLGGKTDAKTALTTLQSGIKKIVESTTSKKK